MDFIEQLQALSAKVPRMCEVLQTEEATKNALVMPFISILGYDIFDPTEVIPEFVADVGIKKGEKVDYAITKDGKIIILFECKHCGANLDTAHASQLYRYFSVTEARVAILTNGVEYRIYSDLEAPNKMDDKPFMVFSVLDIQEPVVAELKKLSKPAFNLDEILSVAGEMKYTREIKRILHEQSQEPSDEMLRLFAQRLQMGTLTQARKEKLADVFKQGFKQFINDRLNERLKNALGSGAVTVPDAPDAKEATPAEGAIDAPEIQREKGVVTSEEEVEGFYIVKSILRRHVDPARIVARDTQSYFGILLDDNNRKPLVRLHFNNKGQKYVGVFDENRQEQRTPIVNLNDIYNLSDQMLRVLSFYEKPKGEKNSADEQAPE
jgi:hypothetical protein